MKKLSIFLSILFIFLFSVNLEARKKKYPNGDYYEGKWKKGGPHGQGVMKYANGDTYIGNWVFGKYSGEGEKTYKTGDICKYIGTWYNNLQHGSGTMYFYNGNVYKGQFDMSKMSGEGEMIYKNNDIYTGTWNDGLRTGNGKLTCKNGDLYEGTWKNDAFYQGKATIGDVIYEGEFSNGFIVKGKQTGPNNSWYEGEWHNGKFMNGKCFIVNKNSSFKGEVKDGSILIGKQTGPNSSWYEGEWHNGKFMNGKCLITNEKNYYKGEIKDGEYYNGEGKCVINDNYYNGKWNNGIFIGKCDLQKPAKNIIEFKGEKSVDGYKGLIRLGNGSYNGKLTNDFKQHGEGYVTLREKNQLQLNGIWNHNRIISGEGKLICDSLAYHTTIKTIENVRRVELSENTTNKTISINLPDSISSDSELLEWVCYKINQENNKLRQAFIDKFKNVGFVYTETMKDPLFPYVKAIRVYKIIALASTETINYLTIPYVNKKLLQDCSQDITILTYRIAANQLKNKFYKFNIQDKTLIFNNEKYIFNPSNNSFKSKDGKIYKPLSAEECKKIVVDGGKSLNPFL